MLFFRPTIMPDAFVLSMNLREEDRNEIVCAGQDPLHAISQSIQSSVRCATAINGNEMLAVYGMAKTGPDRFAPWMLSTPAIERFPIAVMKAGLDFMDLVKTAGLYLENRVHSQNETAIRLIKRLGFTVRETDDEFYTFYADFRLYAGGDANVLH